MSLQDAPFFEFWVFKTISELREMGFDVPDNLADDGGTELGVADLARDYGKSMSLYERDLGNDPSYRRPIAISPLFFPARFHLGQLLLRSGDAAAAASEFAAAAAIQPTEADPVLRQAEARRAEGKRAEAVALARRGAALAPERLDAWLLLGTLAAEAGDVPVLREAIERGSSLVRGESPLLRLLVAKRQRLEGDLDGALSTLSELVRRHPDSGLAREAFLSTAREAGREGEARALLDTLRSR